MNQPCETPFMECVALASGERTISLPGNGAGKSGKRLCAVHMQNARLHPQLLNPDEMEAAHPRPKGLNTPWDDELPWYEQDNRGWDLYP